MVKEEITAEGCDRPARILPLREESRHRREGKIVVGSKEAACGIFSWLTTHFKNKEEN